MAALVVVVVKIIRDAGLRIGQVRKNGPVTEFEQLRFEAGPQTLGLGMVVALAAAAVQELGLGVAQQRFVYSATPYSISLAMSMLAPLPPRCSYAPVLLVRQKLLHPPRLTQPQLRSTSTSHLPVLMVPSPCAAISGGPYLPRDN